jgi:hypothetical protein
VVGMCENTTLLPYFSTIRCGEMIVENSPHLEQA